MSKKNENILTLKVLIKSLIQGLVLFFASFGVYYIHLKNFPTEANIARSMGLAIIMISNILLVQVNSSNNMLMFKSVISLKKDPVMWITIIGTVLGLVIILYSPLASILSLAPLSFRQIGIVIITSMIAVLWYEIVKVFNKNKVA